MDKNGPYWGDYHFAAMTTILTNSLNPRASMNPIAIPIRPNKKILTCVIIFNSLDVIKYGF